MYTRCPHCHTVFRLRPEQLEAADGMARCGNCFAVFDARANLLSEPDAEPAPQPETPTADGAAAPPADAPQAPPAVPPEEDSTGVPEWLAEEERAAEARLRATHRTFGWAAASVLLLAALSLQYAWFESARLAERPALRPWVERFCDLARCTVPPRRAPEAIVMTARDVRNHPDYADALLINAIIVNRAGFAQPYPLLELSLTDTSGAVVGARRFRPAEYLEDDPGQAQLMGAGARAQVRLEVLDPGDAAGFAFRFLDPGPAPRSDRR